MAKKRTVKPYYGKINQRLEQRARNLMAAGDREGANEYFKLSESILEKRKYPRRNGF